MKYLISVLLLCILGQTAVQAQLTPAFVPTQFRIYIENSEIDSPYLYQFYNGEFYVNFTDYNISAIFANYTVTKFERSFPSARRPYMKRYWDIETYNSTLIDDLLSYDSTMFLDSYIILPPISTYTPNDFGKATGQQNDLELINAKNAWNFTKGDPSIVVGISDTWFDFTNIDLPLSQVAQVRDNTPRGATYNDMVLQ